MEYTIRRSARARYMRLTVRPGGAVVVTAPTRTTPDAIRRFLKKESAWLEKTVLRMAPLRSLPVSGRRDYLAHKEEARAFITERVAYWSARCGYAYGRIAIKNTKRLWGSCSRAGNLNFSYTLLFLPRDIADYVIVHELCHLRQQNHGPRFWALVAHILPNYDTLRRELRRYLPAS